MQINQQRIHGAFWVIPLAEQSAGEDKLRHLRLILTEEEPWWGFLITLRWFTCRVRSKTKTDTMIRGHVTDHSINRCVAALCALWKTVTSIFQTGYGTIVFYLKIAFACMRWLVMATTPCNSSPDAMFALVSLETSEYRFDFNAVLSKLFMSQIYLQPATLPSVQSINLCRSQEFWQTLSASMPLPLFRLLGQVQPQDRGWWYRTSHRLPCFNHWFCDQQIANKGLCNGLLAPVLFHAKLCSRFQLQSSIQNHQKSTKMYTVSFKVPEKPSVHNRVSA